MLAIVVPTTNAESGIATATQALQRLEPFGATEAVVVVDGAGVNRCVANVDDRTSVIFLDELHGSYGARNVGASAAKEGASHLCFIDDSVEVIVKDRFRVPENAILGAPVVFDRAPEDCFELWYSINAFDQEEFLERFSFLPTIFLVVPRTIFEAVGGFDRGLVSGGDVDFARRVAGLAPYEISDDVVVRTSLRSRDALRHKLRRQTYGQLQDHAQIMSGPRYRLYVAMRIAVNISGLSGLSKLADLPPRRWPCYVRANTWACFQKCKALVPAAFGLTRDLAQSAWGANKAEVRATEH